MHFEKYLRSGDTVIVGVSGGTDSTALLRLLVEFSRITPLTIIVAHVNHGIRGKAAKHDELFVQKLAQKYKLKFECKRVKLLGQSGIEEKGRAIRHAFFELLANKYSARFILTAHTQDDQVQTIVFNFLRGSGVRGLAGMKILRGLYLKPLLHTSKRTLLAYLKHLHQPYCKDATNNDTELSRNFIRKKILPLFEKLNPAFRETILRNTKIFSELDEWIFAQARDFLKQKSTCNAKEFRTLPQSIQSAVIQEMYRSATKNTYGLPQKNTQQVIDLIDRNIGSKRIRCTGGIEFVLRTGMLSCSRV